MAPSLLSSPSGLCITSSAGASTSLLGAEAAAEALQAKFKEKYGPQERKTQPNQNARISPCHPTDSYVPELL